MKYILVIAIEYKFYKKPADITVIANDRFIDTFSLDKDHGVSNAVPKNQIQTTWYQHFGKMHWLQDNHLRDWVVPKFYRVYELDENSLDKKLEIDVQNSYSDFSNGFMKNSSMIKFPIIALFPKHFVDNQGEKLMEALVRSNEILSKQVEPRHQKNGKTLEWTPTIPWPAVDDFHIKCENEIYQKNGVKDCFTWIGGSFKAEIPIVKKHKTFMLGSQTHKVKGFLRASPQAKILGSFLPLLNIYNEDK